MYNEEYQKNAKKVAFLPLASDRLAICGENGLVLWKSTLNQSKESIATYSWNIEFTITGCYSTMTCSHDGRLIALGSIYSSEIQVFDCRTRHVYKLAGIHATVKELCWSEKSRCLLASTTEPEFRIFKSSDYTNSRWADLGSCVNVSGFIAIRNDSHSLRRVQKAAFSLVLKIPAKCTRW